MKTTIGELKKKRPLLLRIDLTVKDKLTYVAKRNLDKMESAIAPHAKKATEAAQDAGIELASLDDRGNLIENNGAYTYTPENKKLLNRKIAQLNDQLDALPVEFEGYKITDPEDDSYTRWKALFDEADAEALKGILF